MMKKRFAQIAFFRDHPHEVQQRVFQDLIRQARRTEWGQRYGYADLRTPADFRERVPVSSYEDLFPHIERVLRGEQNVLWPSRVRWFAKSSGTTNARSKFIPITPEALQECHLKGGKDAIATYVHNRPDTRTFTGKNLGIGGSHYPNEWHGGSRCGDVSAVIMQNLPIWAQLVRTPRPATALLDEWEQKIEQMAHETARENVTSISGVPTWTIVLIERILHQTGKAHIKEVWPNLEVFIHGAVAFAPYRELFKKLIPDPNMTYLEAYNASEGFFALQDDTTRPDELLLMLDYGIYFEFIPTDELGRDQPRALGLDEVEVGKNYALVISTNAGLWRYLIGDTVRFTSVRPYRVRVSGRTKHFINAFGEEVIVENAEQAITAACQASGAIVADYTAAPIYLGADQKGGHEWLIEFAQSPRDLAVFAQALDARLRVVNSDYDAKRSRDLALLPPVVQAVPEGTFHAWMKKRGKLGGQHKVPRLANDRQYVDDILQMLEMA